MYSNSQSSHLAISRLFAATRTSISLSVRCNAEPCLQPASTERNMKALARFRAIRSNLDSSFDA